MPLSYSYPGIYIQVLPLSTHTITPAPTSIAAFVGYTHPWKTTVFNTAIQLFSFSDYETYFGGLYTSGLVDSDVAQAVYAFFLNGGSNAYVVGLQPEALVGNVSSGSFGNDSDDFAFQAQIIPNAAAPGVGMQFYALEPCDIVPMTATITNLRNSTGANPAVYDTFDLIKAGNVVFSYVNRDLMTALAERNAPVFSHKILLVIIYNVMAAPVVALDAYVAARLMINWRQWLTEQFLGKSFHDRAFYRISSDPSIDNPDQRVSEDLLTFANFTVGFVMQVLQGLVTAASFLVVLWLISPMLVGVLAVCIGGGSILTIVIGRPLIGINFAQRRREADFRYALVGLWGNAVPIARAAGRRRE